jgi:hypothetical protein
VTRFWTELVGPMIDTVGWSWCMVIVAGAGLLLGLAWQTFPGWIPRRGWWRRIHLRWPRWRWPWQRRTRAKDVVHADASATAAATAADQLPDLPSATLMSLADQLAAQGRYAEAVRERLRGIVRELVDAGVIVHRPAWTVSELSRAAARARAPMGSPLDGANRIFSDIWYGQRTALADHDTTMREHAAHVHALLDPKSVAR